MNTSTLHIGPWTLTVESESTEIVDDQAKPDETWRLIDAAGHGHFWRDGYPTLRWVSVPCSMGHGEDCDAEGDWVCPHCDETITPAVKPPTYGVISIPGGTTATLVFDDLRERREYAIRDQEEVNAILRDPVAGITAVTGARSPDAWTAPGKW